LRQKKKQKYGRVKRVNKKRKKQLLAKIINTILRHAVIKNQIHDFVIPPDKKKFPSLIDPRGPVPGQFNLAHFVHILLL
jgi:hypothetical protein